MDWSRALSRRSFVVASACLAAGVLAGCSSEPQATEPSESAIINYQSPYDWAGLQWDGEKLSYYEDGKLRSRWGIDVSEHQGYVRWRNVAAAGVEFAFLRVGNRGATEGTLGVDESFMMNAKDATKFEVPISAYFFSQSLTEEEAREEAEFAIEQMHIAEEQGATFEYLAYDHEPVEVQGARANDLDPDQFTANALAFCEVAEKAGYKPMLYGNQKDLLRLTEEVRKRYPVWLAEYDVEVPTAPVDFNIWQYTNNGTVDGIDVPVDLNLWLDSK